MILSFAQLSWFTLAIILYRFLLYPSARFSFNRWYLILIIPATLFMPYLLNWLPETPLKSITDYIPSSSNLTNEVAMLNESQQASLTQVTQHNTLQGQSLALPTKSSLWDFLPFIYYLGLIGFAVQLLWSHIQLWQIITKAKLINPAPQSQAQKTTSKAYLIPFGQNIAFTYGPCYFVSQDILDDLDWQSIEAHEKVHAAGWHTLDLLLADIFRCLYWFFPPVWWYRNYLRNNLEYIADHGAIQHISSKKNYCTTLLRRSNYCATPTAVAFATHPLKTRIMMLKTKPLSFANYTLRSVLTFVCLLALATACEDELDKKILPQTLSSDQYEIYLTDLPNFDDLSLLQSHLSDLGGQLYITIEENDISHLRVAFDEIGDREQLGILAQSKTPIKLTLDPSNGICNFQYYNEPLPLEVNDATIHIFQNGRLVKPLDIPLLPQQERSIFHLEPNSNKFSFQRFQGPNAWTDAHAYIAENYPKASIKYEYNDHPTHQPIDSPPADLKSITIRLSYGKSSSVRMMLHTKPPDSTTEISQTDLIEAALKLIKPHPTLGLKYEVRSTYGTSEDQTLQDLLKYAYSGNSTNFYINENLVKEATFLSKYQDLDRMILVKSFLDDEPVVVYGE